MRTHSMTRAGAGIALALLLTACGTAVPDTEEVALPDGFGTQNAEKSPDEPTAEEPTDDEPAGEEPTGDAPTSDEPTSDAPTSDAPTGGGEGGSTSTAPSADVCFNPEHEDWAPGSPGEVAWGEDVEISIDEETFRLNIAEPTIRATDFAIEDEPAYVWEADVTATNVEGHGFTSIMDYVLVDTSGNECMIGWSETTLWGLMVYEEGQQETGKAAFLVPTQDIADYELVFVGDSDREAEQVWRP